MSNRIDTQARTEAVRFQNQTGSFASPTAGYSLIFTKADGLYVENSTGTVIGPLVAGAGSAFAPWLVNISTTVSPQSATAGTWAVATWNDAGVTFYPSNVGLQSDGVQNSAVSWDIVLSAGTWSIFVYCRKSTNTGIFTVKIDEVSVGTVDSYAAAPAMAALSLTDVSVAADGKHTLQLLMATKNASSSGYYGQAIFVSLRRTA